VISRFVDQESRTFLIHESTNPLTDWLLPPQFDDCFEHVERELFGVDDVTKVMQCGTAFPHVFERDVVLPKYLMCFLVRHSSPVLKTALEHG